MKRIILEIQIKAIIEMPHNEELEDDIDMFVSELDYEITSCTDGVNVKDTEIIGYDIKEIK